jgi:small subunit ribosomal protein S6
MATHTRTYEAMFLLPGSAVNDTDAAIKLCQGIIERHGGKMIVIKKWDERKLAYEVKKQKRGLYIIAYFTAPGTAITPIERDVQLSEDILRVLVVHADHLNADEMSAVEPQPIIKEVPMWEEPSMMGRRPMGDRPPRRRDESDAMPAKD